MARSLVDIITNVGQFFLGDPVINLAKKGAEGFITAQAIQQRNRAQQQKVKQVSPNFGALPINYALTGGAPFKRNTPSVAGIDNPRIQELYRMYAQALGEIPSNVLTRDSF